MLHLGRHKNTETGSSALNAKHGDPLHALVLAEGVVPPRAKESRLVLTYVYHLLQKFQKIRQISHFKVRLVHLTQLKNIFFI